MKKGRDEQKKHHQEYKTTGHYWKFNETSETIGLNISDDLMRLCECVCVCFETKAIHSSYIVSMKFNKVSIHVSVAHFIYFAIFINCIKIFVYLEREAFSCWIWNSTHRNDNEPGRVCAFVIRTVATEGFLRNAHRHTLAHRHTHTYACLCSI